MSLLNHLLTHWPLFKKNVSGQGSWLGAVVDGLDWLDGLDGKDVWATLKSPKISKVQDGCEEDKAQVNYL